MARTTWLVLVSCLFAAVAKASSPSSPFTAVNTDGRPMTGATVTITTDKGLPAMSVWADAAGTVPYSNVVPSTGVVQFFAEPGVYVVTVAGSGVMRQYYLDIPTSGEGGLTEDSFGTGDGLLWKRGPSPFFTTVKVQLSSLRAPTVDDDGTKGYIPGSIWVDVIHDKAYINTGEATGASQWQEITGGSSGGSGGSIGAGTTPYQVPFWTGVQWLPSSGLWSDGASAGVGSLGMVDTHATLQIGRSNIAPDVLLWTAKSSIMPGDVLGEIDFGATGPSALPRRSAIIAARATSQWGPNTNNSGTSLDFRVQDNSDGDLLPFNFLRLIGFANPVGFLLGKVVAGGGIPDIPTTSAPTAFSTQGIDIYDSAGSKAISLLTPSGLANNLVWSLPNTSGTNGYALTTDGGSPNAQLRWGAVTPGLHAANHNMGGTDEVASYDVIYDEAVALPQRRALAFVGAGITCADVSSKTTCTVANSGGGSGITSLGGDTSAAQTFATGTTGSDFNIVNNLTGGHSFNLPDASFNVRGLMDIVDQSFAGMKSFTQGILVDGTATFNAVGSPTANFQVRSDTNNNAIFVDSTHNSVGIMTNAPDTMGLQPTSLAVQALAGKNAITGLAVSGLSGVVGYSSGGAGSGVVGYGVGTGDSAIYGVASSPSAYVGRFERSVVSSVPMMMIKNSSSGDTQPALSLQGGSYGNFQVSGTTFGNTTPSWGIYPEGRYLTNAVGGDFAPQFSSALNPDTGFYLHGSTGAVGLAYSGNPVLYVQDEGSRLPSLRSLVSLFAVDGVGAGVVNSYIATFRHPGVGNGMSIDNHTGGVGSVGLRLTSSDTFGTSTGILATANIGTVIDARQTGSFAAGGDNAITASVIKAVRENTFSGGATLTGPVLLAIDSSGSNGRLFDLQRPANTSKFWVNGDGATTIDNTTGVFGVTALTVKGTNFQGPALAARFTSVAGNAVTIAQTGASTFSSIDPTLSVYKDITGGFSSAALIHGHDATSGIGRLLELQQPEGTDRFIVDHAGEMTFSGVAFDGTGKVLCVKSDGYIGSCTTVVGSTGTCTCA